MIKTFLKLLLYKLNQIYLSFFSPHTLEILIYLEDMNWHDLVNVFESMDHLQVIALCC